MTDLVERLVPDELWVLFRRVVPPMEIKRSRQRVWAGLHRVILDEVGA